MLQVNKSVNFYASSYLSGEDEMNKEHLANMDASINGDGVLHINKNITSKAAYDNYKDVVEADWAEFEKQVMDYYEVMYGSKTE